MLQNLLTQCFSMEFLGNDSGMIAVSFSDREQRDENESVHLSQQRLSLDVR